MIAMIIILECLIRLMTINGCMAADTYCTTATSKVGKITKKKPNKQTNNGPLRDIMVFYRCCEFFICNETVFNLVSKGEEKETTRRFQFCHFCPCIV